MNRISKQLMMIAKQCCAMTNIQIRKLCNQLTKIQDGNDNITLPFLKKVFESQYKPLIEDLIDQFTFKNQSHYKLPNMCRVQFLKMLYNYDKEKIDSYLLNSLQYTEEQVKQAGINAQKQYGVIFEDVIGWCEEKDLYS